MAKALHHPGNDNAELLRELARVKALFQLRAITAVITGSVPDGGSNSVKCVNHGSQLDHA